MFLFGLILKSLMSISLNDKMRNHILQDNLCNDTYIGDVGDNVILKMLMKCIEGAVMFCHIKHLYTLAFEMYVSFANS